MIAQKGSFCRTYLSSHIAFVIIVSGGFYMREKLWGTSDLLYTHGSSSGEKSIWIGKANYVSTYLMYKEFK